MFSTLKTLVSGANRRAENNLRRQYSIELIEEKIAEAETNLKAAKGALVGMVQKQRAEARHLDTLNTQISDLSERAKAALAAGRDDLAETAAEGIARMENERTMREQTLARLEARVLRLRTSVEAATRRILDLRQGAISARTVRREHQVQSTLTRSLGSQPMDEAQTLIADVLGEDDPFEASEILDEINSGLEPGNISDTLADAGFGPARKSNANDVLARLKSQ